MTTGSRIGQAQQSGYLSIAVALVLLLAAIIAVFSMEVDAQRRILAEGAFVENCTVVLYGACLGLLALYWPWSEIKRRWYFPALIILFALRELDYDKAHFTIGLLKSKQYVGGLVAWPELVLSIGIILFIGAVVVSILARETRTFLSGLAKRSASALAVCAGCALVISSKFLDGVSRKLAAFDIQVSPTMERLAFVYEEIAELGIPVMFAIAILFSASRAQPTASGDKKIGSP